MAVDESKIIETFFSHDKSARTDKKIVRMFFEFRKNKNKFSEPVVRDLLPFAAYGVYWSVVEYMHRNHLKISDIEMLADEFRIDFEFLKSIMNNFELFRQEDELYVSDRINRNLEFQETQSEKKSKAANARWTLAALKNSYMEIFNKEAPTLTSQEVKTFLDYAEQIDNFKKKLPDILYTTKNLKFANNPDFDPGINWLLKDNHLGKLLNEEYGKLLSWSADKEKTRRIKEAEAAARAKKEAEDKAANVDIDSITSKAEAIEIIVERSVNLNFIRPDLKELLKKFDITQKELEMYKEKHNA